MKHAISFTYRGVSIQIRPSEHRGKPIHWIIVRGREITFVSNCDTAKRIAIGFVDVVLDEGFAGSTKYYSPAQNDRRINH